MANPLVISLLSSVFLLNHVDAKGCPDYFQAWGSNCYYISHQTNALIDFDQAESACKEWGSDLVSIHSEQENEFIRQATVKSPNTHFWIGLYKDAGAPAVDSKYLWTDGSDRTYANWGPNHPHGTTNQKWYGFFHGHFSQPSTGGWYDVPSGTLMKGYICKTPELLSTTPGPTTPSPKPTTITPITTPPPTLSSATDPTIPDPTSTPNMATTTKAPVIYRPVPDMMVMFRCILDPVKICNTSPGCEPRSRMADKDNCTNFLRCGIDRKWYAEPCPKGRRYDYRSCLCSWSWMASCFTPTLCPVITA